MDRLTGFSSGVATYATNASYRTVNMVIDEDNKHVTMCPEGPPDVAQAISAIVTASLKAAGGSTKDPGVTALYAQQIATQIAPLVYRTQGLQLLRDQSYYLCIDRLNGWLGDRANGKIATDVSVDGNGGASLVNSKDTDNQPYSDYLKMKQLYLKAAVILIEKELPLMQATQKAFLNQKLGSTLTSQVTPPQPPSQIPAAASDTTSGSLSNTTSESLSNTTSGSLSNTTSGLLSDTSSGLPGAPNKKKAKKSSDPSPASPTTTSGSQ